MIDELGEDGEPVITGTEREEQTVPARSQASKDPAFVTEWDTQVSEKPETELVCYDCMADDDKQMSELSAGAMKTRTWRR